MTSPDRAALADELAANIIDAAFISPPKSYKLKSGNRELMITILSDKLTEHLAALRPLSPYSGADVLSRAIRETERDHPLPKCEHGNNLKDGSGETLEPTCGCRLVGNPTTLPRDAETESDEVLAQEVHRVAGCQVGSERCKNIIRWYRGKLAQRGPRDAERETIERHDATYLRGWNEGIERVIELLTMDGWVSVPDTIRRLIDALPSIPPREGPLQSTTEQADASRDHPVREAWQPIEDAPRDGTAILATGGGLNDSVQIVSYLEHVGAWETSEVTLDDRDDEADGYSRPTHWQPLPAPPAPSPSPSPTSVMPDEGEAVCAKCGCKTEGEEAWVDGEIWCHPCADAASTTLPADERTRS